VAAIDISWALQQFRDEPRQTRYQLTRDYYLGDHRPAFDTSKFRNTFGALYRSLADNLCPAVVDSVADRLQVSGFDAAGTQAESELGSQAWAIWRRNRMHRRESEVYREALMTGDGYVLVWPDERLRATIWPQRADEVAIEYDENTPGRITRAAKIWLDQEGYTRLTLFFPDRVEKYRSRRATKNPSAQAIRDAGDFLSVPRRFAASVGIGSLAGADVIPNPYGRVPLFHFPNKRYHAHGLSELLDVVPLQDALNKALRDMLLAMEFAAYKQRWATGLDTGDVDPETGEPVTPPFDYGVDRMLTTANPNASFGQFEASDLKQFLEVQENLRSEIARVSGTPLHYLFITRGDFPSGEAMKSAEARFTSKLKGRQASFGDDWSDVLSFALGIDGVEVSDAEPLETLWQNPSPRSDKEIADVAAIKKTFGVTDRSILKSDFGYSDEEIDTMLAEQEQPPAAGAQELAELRTMLQALQAAVDELRQVDPTAVVKPAFADLEQRISDRIAQLEQAVPDEAAIAGALGQQVAPLADRLQGLEAEVQAARAAVAVPTSVDVTLSDTRTPRRTRRQLIRDENGNVTGFEEESLDG
jgi:Phage portal protein, SPP1 Gp6-like